jgi:hypothetical protein
MAAQTLIPRRIRELRAEMEMKALTLRKVAAAAQVPYWSASAILRGRHVDPDRLSRLKKVIEKAPMPAEVTV